MRQCKGARCASSGCRSCHKRQVSQWLPRGRTQGAASLTAEFWGVAEARFLESNHFKCAQGTTHLCSSARASTQSLITRSLRVRWECHPCSVVARHAALLVSAQANHCSWILSMPAVFWCQTLFLFLHQVGGSLQPRSCLPFLLARLCRSNLRALDTLDKRRLHSCFLQNSGQTRRARKATTKTAMKPLGCPQELNGRLALPGSQAARVAEETHRALAAFLPLLCTKRAAATHRSCRCQPNQRFSRCDFRAVQTERSTSAAGRVFGKTAQRGAAQQETK